MSTFVLSHALTLQGLRVRRVDATKAEQLGLHARSKAERLRCRRCGWERVIWKGWRKRTVQTPPMGRCRVVLSELCLQRFRCLDCGNLGLEQVPFRVGKRRWTTRLADLVLELLENMTVKAAADFVHMS